MVHSFSDIFENINVIEDFLLVIWFLVLLLLDWDMELKGWDPRVLELNFWFYYLLSPLCFVCVCVGRGGASSNQLNMY